MYESRFFLRKLWVSRRKILYGLFRKIVVISITLSIIYFTYFWLNSSLMPPIKATVSMKTVSIATDAINETISAEFERYDANNKFVHIYKDEEGNIANINSNIPEINRMSSAMAIEISKKLEGLQRKTIDIPLGTLTNYQPFSGCGPYIKLKILPVGSVKTDFNSELTQAGINQTRYRLYMNISCRVRVIAPLVNEVTEVCMNVPLVDTVIAGKVPQTYIGIDGGMVR